MSARSRVLALAALLGAGPAAARPAIVWLDCEGTVLVDPLAVSFSSAFAQTPASWPRRASIAAARYPESLGVLTADAQLSSGTVVLERVLEENGYKAAGFDEAAAAAAWLGRQRGPAHAFVTQRGRCDAAIRALRSAGGAAGEIFAATVSAPQSSGGPLSEERLRGELLLWAPGREGRVSSEAVELIDVAPTLLDLAGVAIPGSFQGRSLVPLFSGGGRARPAFSAWARSPRGPDLFSIRERRWRLTYDKTAGTVGLFDLEADPAGLRDISCERPAEVLPLLRELLAHVRRTGAPSEFAGSPSQQLLDELIEKGYW